LQLCFARAASPEFRAGSRGSADYLQKSTTKNAHSFKNSRSQFIL